MPQKKKDASLPRPVVSRSEPPESDQEEEQREDDLSSFTDQIRPGLLPAPLKENPPKSPSDPVLPPYADFLHFTQIPEVPRKLAGVQEFRGQSWPLAAPDEICRGITQISINIGSSLNLPSSIFAKRHKFTVINFGEPDLKNEKPCAVVDEEGEGDDDGEEEEFIIFGDLSSKVDFCIRMKSVHKFDTKILKDGNGAFKDVKPKICGACSFKIKACLLPDLRHEYDVTFHHTIHVHGPAGVDFVSEVRLGEKSRIDELSVKICPEGRPGAKPEILRVLQATHFVRVGITVTPSSFAVMPRPLPPELREPQKLVINEDVFDKTENIYEDREEEAAASRPPSSSSPPSNVVQRPSRSEPA